jgi:hypothetical protein
VYSTHRELITEITTNVFRVVDWSLELTI